MELFFLVEENPDGGLLAKGLGISIFSQAGNVNLLKVAIVDAVHCHFDDSKKQIIRLHIVREEVIST